MAEKTEWQSEWPTEPGFWWFYGKCFKGNTDDWHFVKVVKTSQSGNFAYITDGYFLYKEEGAAGQWTKARFPDLPDKKKKWG